MPGRPTHGAEFADEDAFARVISNDEIREKACNLSIPLYVRAENGNGNGDSPPQTVSLKQAITNWQTGSVALRQSMRALFEMLEPAVDRSSDDTRSIGGRKNS